MKGLVYHGNKDLRMETLPEPSPSRDEVKLRVDFCGICATDIEEYLYGPNFISAEPNPLTGRSVPLTTGHEIVGTVVELGDGVRDVEVGQRVVFNGILTCGECLWCDVNETQQCRYMTAVGFGIDGGLTEYLVWPASHIVPLPENVTSREAALTEPASVASHAVKRADVSPGDRVLVLGVGTVGMLAMQIAKSRGAEVFAADTRQMSLDMAGDLGADAVINASDPSASDILRELTNGIGPDKVIDAAGGPQTPSIAVDWVRTGGRVVLVAIYTATAAIDFNSVVGTEKQIIGSIAYDQKDVEEVVGLISSGSLKTQPLISGVIGLDEVVDVGFQRMMAPTKDVFRILVKPFGGS